MATAVPAASPSTSGHHLRRDVSRIGLLFTGVGSIIGSGWLFGAYNASTHAGPSAIFSWLIGGVMIMLIGLVYAELGAMYPISGGVVRFPSFTHGGLTSYSVGWITWLAAMSVAPIEVEAALQYATNYWPHFTHVVSGTPVLTGYGYAAAAVLMLLFSLINVIGVGLFSRINTPIVWWKLGIILLVIISFFARSWHASNFTSHAFFTSGSHGMFEAVAVSGIVFSYLGFRQGVELAGETRNPQRTVPFAVLGSVAITMLIYIALQSAFILALPPSLLNKSHGWANLSFTNDFGPLAGISSLLGLSWLAYLLYADAFISPADTGLIYTTVTARISYAMGRNRNAPVSLSKLSSRGVPYVSVIVTFFAGLVIFAPFPGWQKLVGFITSATVLSFASGPIVLSSLRRTMPHTHRPFRLPVGDVIAFLAFFSSNMIVYWAGWDTNWKLFAAVGIGFAVYFIWRALSRNADHAPWNLKSFSWVPFWLGGLVVICWVGSYPDQSAHAGNLGDLSFTTAWPIIGAFSLVLFVWGVAVRLPAEQIEHNIATMQADEPAVDTYPDQHGARGVGPGDYPDDRTATMPGDRATDVSPEDRGRR